MDIGKIDKIWEIEPQEEPPAIPVPEPAPQEPVPSK